MEFYKDNVFVELSDEERETLSKAEKIIDGIWKELMRCCGCPTLDLQHGNYIARSCNRHDFIEIGKTLNALALNDNNKVRDCGNYGGWDEVVKYEENRR